MPKPIVDVTTPEGYCVADLCSIAAMLIGSREEARRRGTLGEIEVALQINAAIDSFQRRNDSDLVVQVMADIVLETLKHPHPRVAPPRPSRN